MCSLPLGGSQGEPPPRRVSVRVERSLAHQGSRTSFESVLVRRDAPISELLHATSASSGVPWNKLILADVWQNKVHRFFCATDPVDEVTQQDDVVAYEAQDPQLIIPGRRASRSGGGSYASPMMTECIYHAQRRCEEGGPPASHCCI